MEYPTLFTGGAYFIAPQKTPRPEDVTIHEFIHNYFYGILGTNEFEDAWMDEGMTSFYDSEAYFSAYGEPWFTKRYFGIPFTFKDIKIPIESEGMIYYIQAPEDDYFQRLSWEFRDAKSYTANVYGKGEVLLRTLQRLLGKARYSEMIKSYAQQWSFGHPKPADFLRVLSDYAPREITGLIGKALSSSDMLDYAIDEIHNRRVPPLEGQEGTGGE
jgi:aminopeptidase N